MQQTGPRNMSVDGSKQLCRPRLVGGTFREEDSAPLIPISKDTFEFLPLVTSHSI